MTNMSTEATQGDDDLKERIVMFLRRNFPQIQMHGGSAAITHLDRDAGEVTVQLGGACSGCGISPMTIQAIKTRMVQEIPEIEMVYADTGMDGGFGGMSPPQTGSPATGSGDRFRHREGARGRLPRHWNPP